MSRDTSSTTRRRVLPGIGTGVTAGLAGCGGTGDNADQSFEPLVLGDHNADPSGDTARVRVVHASPDAPVDDVTLASNGHTIFDGEAGYTEVPGDDYTVQVRGDTEGNDGEVVADTDVSLSGGQVYTIFAAGYLTPDDDPADVPFLFVFEQDTGGGM